MTTNNEPTVSTFKQKSNLKETLHHLKGPMFVFMLIVIIVLVAVLISRMSSKKPQQQIVSDICTTSSNSYILKDASSAFLANNLNEQATLVTKIKTLPNYTQDPNCMYVLTYYYINAGNIKTADSSLTQLEKVYNSKTAFSIQLAPSVSINQLKSLFTAVQKTQGHNLNVTYLHNAASGK